MTLEEWWEHEFIGPGSAVGFDKSFALDVWNAGYIEGQKAMRERVQASTQDAINDFKADGPYTKGYLCALEDVACGVSAMPIEGE